MNESIAHDVVACRSTWLLGVWGKPCKDCTEFSLDFLSDTPSRSITTFARRDKVSRFNTDTFKSRKSLVQDAGYERAADRSPFSGTTFATTDLQRRCWLTNVKVEHSSEYAYDNMRSWPTQHPIPMSLFACNETSRESKCFTVDVQRNHSFFHSNKMYHVQNFSAKRHACSIKQTELRTRDMKYGKSSLCKANSKIKVVFC